MAADELAISEALPERRQALEAMFPGVLVSSEVAAADSALIAVKPGDVAAAVGAAVAAGAGRILSIAAGVRLASLEAAAGPDVAVVRAMPNTPALIREGASAIAAGPAPARPTWPGPRRCSALSASSRTSTSGSWTAVTAVSGSGPAYVFLVAEALVAAGVENGLSHELAERLTTQLLVGSAALLAPRGDAAALRTAVTSPGGTTAGGLAVLDGPGVRDAVAAAVRAAAARSAELGL